MGKVLHAAVGALGVVLVIDDVESFLGEEALLDGDTPGTIVGVAVAWRRMVRAMGRPVDVIRMRGGMRSIVICPEIRLATTAHRAHSVMLWQRASDLCGLLHDPPTIADERRNAGEAAAAFAVAGSG
jgi:hypothetical protein